MARLSEEQKRFIVRRIACFVPLTQIRQEFKAEFDIELSEDQASKYDPTTAQGDADLGEELKKYFDEVRERYIADEESVPIAHKAYRLRLYQQLLEHQVIKQAPTLQMALLKQAAMERGGMFERPKQETGGDGMGGLLSFFQDALKKAYPDPTPPADDQ